MLLEKGPSRLRTNSLSDKSLESIDYRVKSNEHKLREHEDDNVIMSVPTIAVFSDAGVSFIF